MSAITANKPYGCHNQPRPVAGTNTHQAQAGWSKTIRDDRGNPHRHPIMMDIEHVMSTDCRYDASTTDPRCSGCKHIKAVP
jgi:hypothetical protein